MVAKTALQRTEAFAAFHAANPSVFDDLVELARAEKAFGSKNWGVGAVFEVMRWKRIHGVAAEPPVDIGGGVRKSLKLDASHRSMYTRLLELREPELKGFFRTRKLRSAVDTAESEAVERRLAEIADAKPVAAEEKPDAEAAAPKAVRKKKAAA